LRLSKVLVYRQLIVHYAKANFLYPSLVAGLITQESGGQVDIISVAGAVGLMQIMPKEVGFTTRPTRAELLDPEINIKTGCELLKSLRTKYKTQAGMLAAYFGAVNSSGYPTIATDATGSNGWDYVRLVEAHALDYIDLDCDTGFLADEDFRQYAPNTGEWREVAINLLGVCNDALQAGRSMKGKCGEIASVWGDR